MAISINGTTGISGVDGSASSPSVRGVDPDAGIVFGTDTAAITTAGTERLSIDGSGNVGINATPLSKLDLNGNYAANVVAMAALDVDCSLGNYFTKTIAANSTLTFSNAPSGRAYGFALEVTHTSGTITWPSSVKWSTDSAPTLNTGNTHLFVFVTDDGGSRWRGAALVDYVN